jgi:hypothetical protein
MAKRACTQVICLYMACWACRDHYMVWFFDPDMGFYQGFSLRISNCG